MKHPAVRFSAALLIGLVLPPATADAGLASTPDEDVFPVPSAIIAEQVRPTSFAGAMPGLGRVCGDAWPQQAARQQAEPQKTERRPWRVLGWLYRTIRSDDASDDGSPPLLFYLRSPLLAGFGDEADCADQPASATPSRCEVTAVRAHKRGARTVNAVLPQLGASTPAGLVEAVQGQLEAGAAVTLRTTRGGEAVLRPGGHDEIVVTACAPAASGDQDAPLRR